MNDAEKTDTNPKDAKPKAREWHPWRVAQYPEGFYLERWIRGRHYEPVPIIFDTLEAAEAALASETQDTVDLAITKESSSV